MTSHLPSADLKLIYFKILAATFTLLAFIGAFKNYSPIPVGDMWNGYLDFYVKASQGDLKVWWSQHNEHRILLSRILFFVDLLVFSGRGFFLICMNYLTLSMVCLIFWKIWREVTNLNHKWAFYFLVAWLFSWQQKENLVWGFQTQFIIAQLFPLCAFYFIHLANKANEKRNLEFNLAILFAILSVGTMANGILAMPLLLTFSILARFPLRRILKIFFLSILVIVVYFCGYHSPEGHNNPLSVFIQNPFWLIGYCLLYLGGPFLAIFGKTTFGYALIMFAGLFIPYSFFIFFKELIFTNKKNSIFLVLLIFILFVLLTAFITASGRVNFGISQALSSRYETPVLMAWAACILLYLPKIIQLPKIKFLTVKVFSLAVLLLLLPKQFEALKSIDNQLFENYIAVMALELGINDQEQIKNIFPYPDWAFQVSKVPIEQNLSIFGIEPIKDAKELLDNNLINKNHTNLKDCDGVFDDVKIINEDSDFLRLYGYLVSKNDLKTIPSFAQLIDNENVIKGGIFINKKFKKTSAGNTFKMKGYIKKEMLGKKVEFIDFSTACHFYFTL